MSFSPYTPSSEVSANITVRPNSASAERSEKCMKFDFDAFFREIGVAKKSNQIFFKSSVVFGFNLDSDLPLKQRVVSSALVSLMHEFTAV